MKRCFISIDLPKDVIDELVKLQKDVEKTGLIRAKMTEQENIHLTLKFLGEIDDDKIDDVRRRLSSIDIKRLRAETGEIGVFSEQHIRIIWVKLNGIEELQREVDKALEGIFNKEERFMSHITIARVKSVQDKDVLLSFLKRQSVERKGFDVTSFALKLSELGPEGPKYSDIERYDLS